MYSIHCQKELKETLKPKRYRCITKILLLQLEKSFWELNDYHQVEKLDFINNIVQEANTKTFTWNVRCK